MAETPQKRITSRIADIGGCPEDDGPRKGLSVNFASQFRLIDQIIAAGGRLPYLSTGLLEERA